MELDKTGMICGVDESLCWEEIGRRAPMFRMLLQAVESVEQPAVDEGVLQM